MTSANPPTGLHSLPSELILQIGEALAPTPHNLASFLRTSRRFAVLLSPILVSCAVRTWDTHNGRSVLHWAAATGRDSLLLALLAHGADVGSVDYWRDSPLHSAVLSGSTVTVTLLLTHGADIWRRNAPGWNALDLAAIAGYRDIAEVLLQYGAQIVARGGGVQRSTPFHYAVMMGHVGVVELFLSHGADVAATDKAGWSVKDKAAIASLRNGQEAISRLLFGTVEGASAVVASSRVARMVCWRNFR